MAYKSLVAAILMSVLCSRPVSAVFGPFPGIEQDDVLRACQEAGYSEGTALAQAFKNKNLDKLADLLGQVLTEWRAADVSLGNYPAKSFCLFEVIPGSLPAPEGIPGAHQSEPTALMRKLAVSGLEYVPNESGGTWSLRLNPVDLEILATKYVKSDWGRQAFLLMTKYGWNQGECGPYEFKTVIQRGEDYLKRYPNSDISVDVRMEVAAAYATWWNLATAKPDAGIDPRKYQIGADAARRRAIVLFEKSVDDAPAQNQKIREWLHALESKVNFIALSRQYDYFCPEHSDTTQILGMRILHGVDGLL